MPNLIRRIATRLRRLNERLNIVATGDENEYYAWADQRLDELAEEARIACRNIRRDGNKHFDDAEKAKTMTEDDRDKGKAKMQDQLKSYEGKIDALSTAKEKEVMEQ